jgi:ABC-type nitrate/sulfonate/bicarbonate transport system substrate-binding protein
MANGFSTRRNQAVRISILLVASAMLGTIAAEAQQPGGAVPTVTVAVAPSTDMSLMIIAVKKGFLDKEGVAAQLQLFDSAPAALQGVVAGRADVTNNTEPPQLAARARGAKIVQVMTGYLSGKQNGLVVNAAVIKKPVDLIGKAVGVQRGSGANYHLAWFLERNKIPADKVAVKYMDAPDQIAAMARGDIQAFFSWEPFLTKAADTVPDAKIFSRTIDDGFVFAGNVVMPEEIAKNHKDVAMKVVNGLIGAASWTNANWMEAAKVANEVLRAPSVELLSQQMQYLDWPADFRRKVYEQEVRIAEWGVRMGLFPSKDAKKLVDELIYPAIIKEAAPTRTDL